jgi:hypothetical protein
MNLQGRRGVRPSANLTAGAFDKPLKFGVDRGIFPQGFPLRRAEKALELTPTGSFGNVFRNPSAVMPSPCFGDDNVLQDQSHVDLQCIGMWTGWIA